MSRIPGLEITARRIHVTYTRPDAGGHFRGDRGVLAGRCLSRVSPYGIPAPTVTVTIALVTIIR